MSFNKQRAALRDPKAKSRPFSPKIGKNVFIHPSATVVGRVTLKDHVSVWPGAVLRADLNRIVIGRYTNIQDLTVVHLETDRDCVVGDYCVIGHRVILHGCRIGDRVLVGMGAIILNGAEIGDGVLIGAGALVTENMKVEDGSLYLGTPAKFVRKLKGPEVRFTVESAKKYAQTAQEYMKGRYPSAP